MSARPSRLALGDWLIAIGAVGLLVTLFGAQWYQAPARFRDSLLMQGHVVSANGWNTFTWIGPLCLIVSLLGCGAFALQLTRDSPALPTVTVILLAPFALLLVVVLIVREFVDRPGLQLASGAGGSLDTLGGAYVGLGFAALVLAGAWRFLRRDQVAAADSPALVETLPLGPASPAGHS